MVIVVSPEAPLLDGLELSGQLSQFPNGPDLATSDIHLVFWRDIFIYPIQLLGFAVARMAHENSKF